MSANDAAAACPAGRWPGLVIAAVSGRRAVRSAVIWGALFAVYLASSALGYVHTYPTAADRHDLIATFGANGGVNAIIGPARRIDTVAGFTAWRSLGVLSLVGAVWGLLIGTRLLRGEEEAGRWELLLAGGTTRRRAAGQALAGLVAGLLALWVIPAVVLILVGRSGDVGFTASAAAFDVAAVVMSAAVFVIVGALAGELMPTRRQAAAAASGVLGAAYALRMAADSGAGLDWLRWASPLGWVEESRPLTGTRPLALLPAIGLVLGLGALTVRLAGVRDLGASTIADRASAPPHTRLLSGPTGLTARLVRPTLIGWSVAIAVLGLILGFVAKSAGAAIERSPSFQQTLGRLGAHGVGAYAYLGVGFLIVALLLTVIAAGQLTAARDEEASGRLDHLLVRPTSRPAWLLGRVAVTCAALVIAAGVAAVFTWAGAASQDSGVGLSRLVRASANVLSPAIVVLGVGVLALGVRPRLVTPLTYVVLVWSFLVDIVGGVVSTNHWLLDTSLFHHLAAAPASSPDWGTNAAMLGFGATLIIAGAIAFVRRDVVGE